MDPTFELLSTEQHFLDKSNGYTYIARTLQPSEPSGAWPGTTETIREWKILSPDGTDPLYYPVTVKQMLALEQKLGQIERPLFVHHPTLGTCVLVKLSP